MTFAQLGIEWEPVPDGLVLDLKDTTFKMPMTSVRELRDDMEEANFEAQGFFKVDLDACEIDQYDRVRVLGHDLEVKSLLRGREGMILDLAPLAWHEGVFEVVLPLDFQVTVYRPIAGGG